MITILEDYITVKEFAALCGINNKAVYERIKLGKISGMWIGKIFYANKKRSLIAPRVNARLLEQFKQELEKIKPGEETVAIPSAEKLMSVKAYAKRLKIRADAVYENIIAGKIDTLIIAGSVFIDVSKSPFEKHNYTRKLRRKR